MPNKTPAILSGILTFFLLSIVVFFVTFAQVVILNGASEKQGSVAIGGLLLGGIITTLTMGSLAGFVTNHLITKRNWNKVVAVVIPVLIGTTLGLFLSLLLVFVTISVAGIQ